MIGPPQSTSAAEVLSTSCEVEQDKSTTIQKTQSSIVGTTPAPVKDPMGDFTRWFVLADKGLMKEELEEFAVKHILQNTWDDFKSAEADRIRHEEEEKSLAEALRFRRYSLRVTFFYRWRDITRKRRVVKRIQLEKEKARQWNSLQSTKERESAKEMTREKAVREAKELIEERTKEQAREAVKREHLTYSTQKIEDALIDTGVFKGLRDERKAARHAAENDDADLDNEITPTERLRLRSENQRRRKRGLPPLKRFPGAEAHREGSKTAMLRAIASGRGRDSLSSSTGSLRNSTFSSSYRSSLGFNQGRVAKSRTNVSDPYWRMKANGLIQMPNGEYLHETLALPMLREGKRFPGLGDYGLPPIKTFTPSQSPPVGAEQVQNPVVPTSTDFPDINRASTSSSIIDGAAQKRKRNPVEDEDLIAYRNETSASRKRTKSGDRVSLQTPSTDQDFLDSIANLLDRVNSASKPSTS
jgi:nuclear mRNA export protein SAC3